MTQPHTLANNSKIIIIPVPKDAEDFQIVHNAHFGWMLDDFKNNQIDLGLPNTYFDFKILGTYSKLKQEIDFKVKEEWCEKETWADFIGYKKYLHIYREVDLCVGAKESFLSLLHSLTQLESSELFLIVLIGEGK